MICWSCDDGAGIGVERKRPWSSGVFDEEDLYLLVYKGLSLRFRWRCLFLLFFKTEIECMRNS